MRISEILSEESFGTAQRRKVREGSRPARGHKEESGYKQVECELEEAGKAPKKLCLSKKSDSELGASQLSSCKAQGLRKRDTDRKFKIGKGTKKIKGTYVKASDYGGPLPKWKGNE